VSGKRGHDRGPKRDEVPNGGNERTAPPVIAVSPAWDNPPA
jgi:hypothetical protein